ncbi:MAG: exodeoxyribonuclease VII large subunit [Candidatus Aminicenantes bacterium]|nr:exodeoxyribonuclease VII large subunit [Candidatus Aminicenantes bacterium]
MKWITAVIKGTEVSIAFDENSIHIYNAYLIKDDLKLRGYRWNPNDKSWHANPGDVEAEMNALRNKFQQSKPVSIASRDVELSEFPTSSSVVELRNRIDRLIREGLQGQIWTRGIIASRVKNYQWYSYFDLKDEDENQDIYFNMEVRTKDLEQVNRKLKESGAADSLDKDLPVFCLVEVHLSFRNAVDIRLRVLDILPEYTQAKIRNQREITLDKLKEEGILDKQKRLSLPALIPRVGLITSEQGTSIGDIMAGLSTFEIKYSFFFIDTRMEGVNAVESIIGAVDYLENSISPPLDAIIIARGGGSEQSLAIFNDYRLCCRICNCTIPVLTAIGHEKDISAAEICSFFTPAPATPSGMGKYLHERFGELQLQLSDSVRQLINYFSNMHNREMEKIKAFVKNIPINIRRFLQSREERFSALVHRYEQSVSFTVRDRERGIYNLMMQILTLASALRKREKRQVEKTVLKSDFQKRLKVNDTLLQEIRHLGQNVTRQSGKVILEQERNLQNLVDLIKASDPGNILKKGFTLTLDKDDRVIKTMRAFSEAENTRLKFHDGIVIIKKEEDL